MSKRMRVTRNDKLTVGSEVYRRHQETDTGYAFECVDRPTKQVHYSFEEFEALLSMPDVVFEPGYFLVGQTNARINAGLETIGSMKPELRERVAWRYLWVTVAMHLVTNAGMNKTDRSIAEFMPKMEAHVNELARAARRKWKAPRAGRTNVLRDPPCSKTLRTWLKRYEQGDYSYLALLPHTHRSGNRNDRFCLLSVRLLGDCVSAYLTRQRLPKKQVAKRCKSRFEKVCSATIWMRRARQSG